MIAAPLLARCPEIRHGFFGRTGGVSRGLYASLNVGAGSDDRPENVAENRARVASAFDLPPERLFTVHQTHSATVETVDDATVAGRGRADALVTDRAGRLIGVLTADCAPVLLADARNGVVGAAHAGWLGALRGIVDATVDAMEAIGASRGDIAAAVGPAIAQGSYEVGPEFRERFLDDDSANASLFAPSARDGHHRFDLPGYVLVRLAACGIRRRFWTGGDTCARSRRFFSYRRSVKRGEPDYGRQISAIALVASSGPG